MVFFDFFRWKKSAFCHSAVLTASIGRVVMSNHIPDGTPSRNAGRRGNLASLPAVHADNSTGGPCRSSPPITETQPAQAPTDADSSRPATPRPIDRHADRTPPQTHRNATQTAPGSGVGKLSTTPADAPRTPRNAPKRNVKRLYNEETHKKPPKVETFEKSINFHQYSLKKCLTIT